MPAKNPDLHGNAPDKSSIALILIDVINDFEFEGGEELFKNALPASRHLADLKQRATAVGIPVIYANDNFGRWRSDFREVVAHCLNDQVRGEPITRLLKPDKDDYFVLKPKHSAFFSTTLEILLNYLGATSLILGGFTTDSCVLLTAGDAHMRDYKIFAPSDCMAAISAVEHEQALNYMMRILDVDITPSTRLDLEKLRQFHSGTTTS